MKQIISIRGMSCMHCVNRVKKALIALEGVTFVDVDLSSSIATIEYDQTKTTMKELHTAIEIAGYSVII